MLNFVKGIPEKLDHPFVYAICEDGLYLVKRVMGNSVVSIKMDEVKGYPKGRQFISLNHRKIPISYFWKIVEFFKYVRTKFDSNVEAYAIIAYSSKEDSYQLYIPRQVVGIASVKYDLGEFYKLYPGYSVILDIHVHPGAGAFWSGVDSNDDNRDRFSGVVGNLDKIFPNYLFRFGANSKFIEVTIDDLFTDVDLKVDLDFNEAIKNISVNSPTITSSGYSPLLSMFNKEKSIADRLLNKYMKKDRDFTLAELFPNDY